MRTLLSILVQLVASTETKKIFAFVIVILMAFMFVNPSMGQDLERNNEEGWNFLIAPYLFVPFISGEIGVKDYSADFNKGPGELIETLDFAVMLYLEASNPQWALIMDALYLKSGKDITLKEETQREGTVGVTVTSIGFSGMRRLAIWFELGIGGRVNFYNMQMNVEAGAILPEIDEKSDDTWFDPLIVYRLTAPLNNEKWKLGLHGDFGGFGVGSKFTYMVYPYAGYQFSSWFELSLGFRTAGFDFENNTEDEEHKLDVLFYGPQIGFLFHL